MGGNAGSEDIRKYTSFSQEKREVNIRQKNKKAT
jgi:hypothetical protein